MQCAAPSRSTFTAGYRGYLGVSKRAIVTLFPIFSYPLVRALRHLPRVDPHDHRPGDLLARRHRLVGTLGNLPLALPLQPVSDLRTISNALFIDTNSRPGGRNTS